MESALTGNNFKPIAHWNFYYFLAFALTILTDSSQGLETQQGEEI